MHTGTNHHLGRHRDDRGFTLVELLIVIVILGILATVTVFAVRGITTEGEENAEAVDLRAIQSATEAYYAQNGSYPDEATLVANGYMSEDSDLHDITVDGSGNLTIENLRTGATETISPVVGGGGGGGAPVANASAGTAVTVGGVPMLQYGPAAASRPYYIIGGAVAGAQWDAAVNASAPILGAYTFRFIDVADIPDTATALDVRNAMLGNWGAQLSTADDIAGFDGSALTLYETIEALPTPVSWVRFNPGPSADVADIMTNTP